METKTTWHKASEKVNHFYSTNIAIIFFMSATTLFAFIQVILYSLNIMKVNGHFAADSANHFLSWILLISSIIGTYCGFIGGIMVFRGSLSFIYWQTISTSFAVVTQVLATMWFGAFVSFYFILMNFLRFFLWRNGQIEKWNLSNERIMIISTIYFIIIFIIMNTLATVFANELYLNNSLWMKRWNCNFDATGASLNMAASFIMMFKVRWAFAFYALAKVFTISNYAAAGLIVPIVQMMLFWVMDITGFIGWSINKPVHTKKVQTPEPVIE